MAPEAPNVNQERSYDSSVRRERARHQYDSTLETARQLFVEHGYGATTVGGIAQAAGVSAATVYKTYGGKAGLIRELCRRALQGRGTTPAEQRSEELRADDDPHRIIEGWAALTIEVSPRVSPLLLVLQAAAGSDDEAAALLSDLDRTRLARMADNARHLARAGHLRSGATTTNVRDVLWLCSSPELYDLLVIRRGWSLAQYERFIADTIKGACL